MALQKINNNPPNAVLLDIKLPDMNGVDMLQQIKQIYPNMVVIILTDYPNGIPAPALAPAQSTGH